jgi:hypothetical protein
MEGSSSGFNATFPDQIHRFMKLSSFSSNGTETPGKEWPSEMIAMVYSILHPVKPSEEIHNR